MLFVMTHQTAGAEGEPGRFPVNTEAVTADHLIALRRDLGVAWADVQAVLDDVQAGREPTVDPLVVVAMAVLALIQAEVPADPSWLAARMGLDDEVTVTVLDDEDAPDPS